MASYLIGYQYKYLYKEKQEKQENAHKKNLTGSEVLLIGH
jgi:hypothetical protein